MFNNIQQDNSMVTNDSAKRDSILKIPQVQQITGLSRSGIYAKIKEGTFPKQIKLGLRASGWVESEVYAFVQQQIAASRPEQYQQPQGQV